MRANMWNMTNEEIVSFVSQELDKYQSGRESGAVYGGVQLKDIQQYATYLQRPLLDNATGAKEILEKVEVVLREDGRLRQSQPKRIKSLYELEQERFKHIR